MLHQSVHVRTPVLGRLSMTAVHQPEFPGDQGQFDDRPTRGQTRWSRHRLNQWLAFLLAAAMLGAFATPVFSAPLAKPALEECSKVVVRFNGRVATLEVVAKHWLRSVAGVDSVEDEAGTRYDALSTWFAVASKHAQATQLRLIPIDHARLQKLYQLAPRPADASGRANLYAIADLLERHADFMAERQRISEAKIAARPGATSTAPPLQADDTPEYQDALERLAELMPMVTTLSESFSGPAERTVEAFRDFQASVTRLEASYTPLVIAPRTPEESWRLYTSALFENLKIEILNDKNQQPHPGVNAWNKLLQAAAAGDTAEIIAAAKEVQRLNESYQAATAPFSFQTPDAWRERGTAAVLWSHFYSDTLAHGMVVSSFDIGEGRRKCEVNVHYFPGAIASSARVVNYWRYLQWNAPVETAALREQVQAVSVGSERAAMVQVTQPAEYAGESRTTQLAILVKRDADAIVFMLYGHPDAVAGNRESFQTFAAGIQLPDSKRLARWFPVARQEERPRASGLRMLAAIVPGKKTTWLFRQAESAADKPDGQGSFAELAADFVVKMDSQQASDSSKDESPQRAISPPEGWRPVADGSCFATRNQGLITVMPLEDASHLNEVMLANCLTAGLGLDELSAASAKELWKDEKVGETKVRMFTSPRVPLDRSE